MTTLDSRVYACLLATGQTKPLYLRIRATEGVIAPGRAVVVRVDNVWRAAKVVKPWTAASLGSLVCLELIRVCPRCQDKRWICEAHPDRPWPHDDCEGPGEPCPGCNVGQPPELPDDWISLL